jgi:nucleoside-diphosphate-sugar epimerase
VTLVTPNAEKTGFSSKKLLILGCGYLGFRVAKASVSAGHVVWATTRSRRRAAEIAAAGLQPLIVDWTDRRTLADLPEVDRILVAISYDRHSRLGRFDSQVGGLGQLLAVIPEATQLCYISTTGVYHQRHGEWVDENSPARPTRQGGRAHLCAEQLLHRYRPESPWTILRLSGIYGPGRVPRAADVIAGNPIRSPDTGYLNLIHVDDAAAAVDASWESATQRLYLVSDDRPVVRGDFYREIARQCDAPDPTFLPPLPYAPVGMRSDGNKRIWNRRLKRDLLPRLRFRTFQHGLVDVLARS